MAMQSIRMTVALLPRRRLALIVVAVFACIALVVLACTLALRGSFDKQSSRATPPTSGRLTASAALPSSTPPSNGATLAGEIARLGAAPDVAPATSKSYPPVPETARQQPELYASAFATELLTQDFRRSRDELLAWVQSEATPCAEPLVVGLVPPGLRPKLAVWTVTDTTDGSEPPIPSADDWAVWQSRSGRVSVQVQRVDEPAEWQDAVRTGRITEPGVTARDVDAVVTTQWVQDGHTKSARRSVSLGLTLNLRPDGTGFGFVDIVTYRSVEMGA